MSLRSSQPGSNPAADLPFLAPLSFVAQAQSQASQPQDRRKHVLPNLAPISLPLDLTSQPPMPTPPSQQPTFREAQEPGLSMQPYPGHSWRQYAAVRWGTGRPKSAPQQ